MEKPRAIRQDRASIVRFEWDPSKAAANARKHGVSFEQACEVFVDECALSLFDKKHSRDEDRWVTIGQVGPRQILVVVHTYRPVGETEIVRIISVRKATRKERQQYRKRRK